MSGSTDTSLRTAAPPPNVREAITGGLEGRPGLLGYGLVAALVPGALLIYFLGATPAPIHRPAFQVAGEVCGITAAVLLAMTGILAARVRPLEWLFGDATKVYVAHGILGLLTFAVATFHPLLFVLDGLSTSVFGLGGGLGSASTLIVPFYVVVVDWVGWILIALGVLPTLYLRLRYDLWRYTHLLLGAGLIAIMLGTVVTTPEVDTYKLLPLRIYLFVLFGLAIVSIVHVAFVRRLAEPKREYLVAQAEHHPEADAIELRLSPVGQALRFAPGQFAYVDLLDDRLALKRDYESHPFSIASAPSERDLSVVVGAAGGNTRRIQEIVEDDGARALVHGPYGRLAYVHAAGRKQLWVAGGTGVTPFLSMAAALAEQPDGRPDVTFVIGVNRPEQAFYLDRLRAYEEVWPGFEVILWNRQELGTPTAAGLAERVPDLTERAVLLSGSEAMVAELTTGLHNLGVHREHIHSEVAVGPPRRWRHGSPALKVLRWVVTVELVVFVSAAIASSIGHA